MGEVLSMQLKNFINKLDELTSALSNEPFLDLDLREIEMKLLDS